MLKQAFDREQLMKALSPRDIYRWDIILEHGDIEAAIEKTINHWKSKNLSLSPIQNRTLSGKNTFTPASMEDAFEIKLLDRFIRRIYKVRQSDRNRIVKQLKTLLKDSSETHLLRIDIKNCYENIPLEKLISKFSDDFLLTPECINILKNINTELKNRHDFSGLPRGLSISPTLAELYLERLDREISSHRDVIYSARYVDDIIVILPSNKYSEIKNYIKETLGKLCTTSRIHKIWPISRAICSKQHHSLLRLACSQPFGWLQTHLPYEGRYFSALSRLVNAERTYRRLVFFASPR